MAIVASSSRLNFPFTTNVYEWPSLYEEYGSNVESRQKTFSQCATSQRENVSAQNCAPAEVSSEADDYPTHTLTAREPGVCTQDFDLERAKVNIDLMDQSVPQSNNSLKPVASDEDKGFTYTSSDREMTEPETAPEKPRALDVRPKVFTTPYSYKTDAVMRTSTEQEKVSSEPLVQNENAYEQSNHSETVITRKIKHKKLRQKTNKKWKPLEISEFGFHVSRVPQMPMISSDTKVSFSNDIKAPTEIPETQTETNIIGDNDKINESEENARSELDDVAFFQELGIDVLNYNHGDRGDGLLDWDGVYFPNESHASNVVKKSEHRNRLREKSSMMPKLSVKTRTASSAKSKAADKNVSIELTCLPSPSLYPGMKKCDRFHLFELECSSSKRVYIRRDRHRRVEKAHKSVKSKNCRSIFNNPGRKNLYMHHRLIKLHNLCLDFRHSSKRDRVPPMPKKNIELDVAKSSVKANRNNGGHRDRPAPTQNLKHALHETNAPGHLQGDLANFLISLQHRELTPEDYDMLLRLDDSVKPKTVSKHVLDTLKTEKIGPEGLNVNDNDTELMCTVCMEPYVAGQERKFLPCNHHFHTSCIDMWLKNSSMNCPLDGLPVESS